MKKIAIIAALFALAFTACQDDVTILRKLTNEEASVIPYTMGQNITLVDHNSDTVTLTVEMDEQKEICSIDPFYTLSGAKMKLSNIADCYGRVVKMNDIVYANASLRLIALPDSILGFEMERNIVGAEPSNMLVQTLIDLKENHADSITIEGNTYHDVVVSTNNNQSERIIYSLTEGLLLVKTQSCLYTKVQ